MTTVNLSGTWSEKQRPNNGLERVANYIHDNRITRVPVVGYVEFHAYTEKLTGEVLTVSVPAIEPALEHDGTDPEGLGKQIWDMLDRLRKSHGKGAVEDTLFSVAQEAFDFDRPTGGEGGSEELEGQQEIRLGSDGEHVVPEASAEELLAERAEAKAAEAEPASSPAAATRSGKRAATADPFVPAGGDAA